MVEKSLWLTRTGSCIRADRSQTSKVIRKAVSPAAARYGNGTGSPAGRGGAGHRKGSSASNVTTQGETDVAKFFDKNGPSGCDSQV